MISHGHRSPRRSHSANESWFSRATCLRFARCRAADSHSEAADAAGSAGRARPAIRRRGERCAGANVGLSCKESERTEINRLLKMCPSCYHDPVENRTEPRTAGQWIRYIVVAIIALFLVWWMLRSYVF